MTQPTLPQSRLGRLRASLRAIACPGNLVCLRGRGLRAAAAEIGFDDMDRRGVPAYEEILWRAVDNVVAAFDELGGGLDDMRDDVKRLERRTEERD